MVEPVEGYDAVIVKDTPRFRLNRKMVATDSVPENIKMELIRRIAEEKERRLAAPAVVEGDTTEQNSEGTIFEAPEEEAQAAAKALSDADFTEPTGPDEPAKYTPYELELIGEIERLKEQVSESGLETATIFELANELYKRFGVYTVFINQPPKDGDVHPFNGEVMTRYETGLAYQKFNQVTAQGKLKKDFGSQYQEVERSREASQTHRKIMEQNAVMTPTDHEKQNTFAYRTSVNGQNRRSTVTKSHVNDPISEDATVEPNIRGVTIRPDW